MALQQQWHAQALRRLLLRSRRRMRCTPARQSCFRSGAQPPACKRPRRRTRLHKRCMEMPARNPTRRFSACRAAAARERKRHTRKRAQHDTPLCAQVATPMQALRCFKSCLRTHSRGGGEGWAALRSAQHTVRRTAYVLSCVAQASGDPRAGLACSDAPVLTRVLVAGPCTRAATLCCRVARGKHERPGRRRPSPEPRGRQRRRGGPVRRCARAHQAAPCWCVRALRRSEREETSSPPRRRAATAAAAAHTSRCCAACRAGAPARGATPRSGFSRLVPTTQVWGKGCLSRTRTGRACRRACCCRCSR